MQRNSICNGFLHKKMTVRPAAEAYDTPPLARCQNDFKNGHILYLYTNSSNGSLLARQRNAIHMTLIVALYLDWIQAGVYYALSYDWIPIFRVRTSYYVHVTWWRWRQEG